MANHSHLSTYLKAIMKTFTISNEQVLLSAEGLDHLKTDTTIKLPGLFSIKVARIKKRLNDERETITAERSKIVEEFTVYDGEGDEKKPAPVLDPKTGAPVPNAVKLTDSKEFTAREKALLAGTVELAVPALTEAEFKDLSLPDAVTGALLPFIE